MGPTQTNEPSNERRLLRRAPLAPVAVALTAGIVAGRYAPLPILFWASCGLASLFIAAATLRRTHLHAITTIAVATTVASIGAARLQLAYFAIGDDHIVTYTGKAPIIATIRGPIVTSPQIVRRKDGPAMGYRPGPRTGFVVQAETIQTRDGPRRTSGLIRVTVAEADRRPAAGQKVRLVGRIGRFRSPVNPGEYDSAAAARENGTLVWMTVPGADGVEILSGRDQPAYAKAYWRLRASARQHLASVGDTDQGRLLNALIVGERHPALRTMNRTMMRAGTAHFLSISGMHLGIFLGFVFLSCRALAFTPRRAAMVVLTILAVYLLLAEPRAPLLRSAIMAAALCIGVIAHRRYMPLNALAAAAIVLLAMDPLQIFSPGFQLSFGIVTAIVLFLRPMRQWLFGRWMRRRGLMVFRYEHRLRRWAYFNAANWLTQGVTMCLLAYIVAAPLVAHHFGLFSPYAPLLTLLMLPLVAAVLLPGYVSMALAWPMPNLSYHIGRLAGAAADGLQSTTAALHHLPGLSMSLRPVGWVWVLLCYAALVLTVCCRRVRFGRTVAACSLAVLLAATAYTQWTAPAPAAAELNILAVGAGQCAVLRTPDGKTYLLDAGTQSGLDVYERLLDPFLRDQRLPAPTAAFISHANTDHYNALPAAVNAGSIQRVYLNDYFGREDYPQPAVMNMMGLLASRRVELVRLRAGRKIQLDKRTYLEVLWPPAKRRDDLSVNNTSLVLKISCDGQSVLLTGDLDSVGQAELTAMPQHIGADVLVLPHHGGWEETLPDFCRAVGAGTIVVSAAREPEGPLTNDRAKRFYGQIKTATRYYSTCRHGWTQVRFGAGKVSVQTMR